MQLFWKKGYNGTSMQDLVDVTGLNRSSFYNSFGDKFSLFQAALKHYQLRQNEMIKGFTSNATSPKEAVISLFRGISGDLNHTPQKGCLITSCTTELAGQDDRIRGFLTQNMSQVLEIFSALIKEAQAQGEINIGKDPETLAMYLFATLQGLRVTSILDNKLDKVVDEVLSNL